MKMPASTVFQTPGSVQHVMGAKMKPGMAILANQQTGLDCCMESWVKGQMAASTQIHGTYPSAQSTSEVLGHNLPATDSMSLESGCPGSCGCGGNCSTSKSCDCQHEVDYKTPGMACGCNSLAASSSSTAGHLEAQPSFAAYTDDDGEDHEGEIRTDSEGRRWRWSPVYGWVPEDWPGYGPPPPLDPPTQDPAEKRCGPDVTKWFENELKRWDDWAKKVIASGMGALAALQTYGLKIRYKDMKFETDECPKKCDGTVMLIGKCIHKSSLGNIVFGYIAGQYALPIMTLAAGVNRIGAQKPGEGADNPEDVGGIAAGYHAGTGESKLGEPTPAQKNAGDVRKKFKDTFANGQMWGDGWTDPWGSMKAPFVDCKKCDGPAWGGPGHELPDVPPGMK